MINLYYRLYKNIVCILLSFMFVVFSSVESPASEGLLKKIIVYHDPCSVKLVFSEKIPFKIIKIDKKEILIALKNIRTNITGGIKGIKGSAIKNITIEHLQGKVIALIITGFKKFGHLESRWNKSDSSLIVHLEKTKFSKKRRLYSVKRTPLSLSKKNKYKNIGKTKRADKIKNAKSLKQSSQSVMGNLLVVSKDERVYIPETRKKSVFAGDISDIVIKADVSGCSSNKLIMAVNFLKAGLWYKGFNLLNNYIEKNNTSCLEQAYFLRAYAAMKYAGENDTDKLLTAADFFQSALTTYPASSLSPFAFASLGIIHLFLKNSAAAQGFFNLVAENYPDYTGLPEALYYLGTIYGGNGYDEKALKYYKKVFEDFPLNTYTVDAGIGVGKELFRRKHYIDSLKILSYLVKKNPAKIYKSSELLLVMGNANFELGRSVAARNNLIKVLNLFSDIKSKDMILTHIGDTYAMENNFAKAESIYRLVMKKFPGGDGYVTSAMHLAKYLKDRSEKEKIYNMVKKDFFDNKMAGVAMMRLAALYNKYGEYTKCIEEIENLLSTHPRELRYEAVKLMQKAYETMFDKQLKSDHYPKVMQKYEQKHVLLDRLDSKKIALYVGLAYARAHLNEQAFNQLMKAYKLYKRSSRPPELLFALGVVMDDSGRKDDALKILQAFVTRFPHNGKIIEAYTRMGNIFLKKNKSDKALDNFSMAYKACKDNIIKGKILEKKAAAYTLKQNWPMVSDMLVKALDSFALAQGNNYDLMVSAYKKLGESYMYRKLYVKAGDTFSLALKFSGDNNDVAEIGFMMGDAYEKANIMKKAKQAFKKVVAGDDSIWSRLAKDRLSTLQLAKEIRKS